MTWRLFCSPIRDVVIFSPCFMMKKENKQGGSMMAYYGAIEAGGTKFCCAIGNEHGDILEEMTIPTEHPEKTIQKLIPFFEQHDIAALGVGSFGPICVQRMILHTVIS